MRISDWSSDVCSSDLEDDREMAGMGDRAADILRPKRGDLARIARQHPPADRTDKDHLHQRLAKLGQPLRAEDALRSEERRVGKEGVSTCRSRWSLSH